MRCPAILAIYLHPHAILLGHRAGSILEEAVKQQQHEAMSQEEHPTAAPVSKRPALQALALLSESLMESSLQEMNS